MSAISALLAVLHQVTVKERDDLAATMLLVCGGYQPCDKCGAPAAEFWHWNGSYSRWPPHDELDELTAYCVKCVDVVGLREECVSAEPEEEVSAIARVRHLFWKPNQSAWDHSEPAPTPTISEPKEPSP